VATAGSFQRRPGRWRIRPSHSLEQVIFINTAAAGGNASLIAMGDG
jgi:delta 1-pyrroline-5-carboxylate dehydrogenase